MLSLKRNQKSEKQIRAEIDAKAAEFACLVMSLTEAKLAAEEEEYKKSHRLALELAELAGANKRKKGRPKKTWRDLAIVQAIWELRKLGYNEYRRPGVERESAISIVHKLIPEVGTEKAIAAVWEKFTGWRKQQCWNICILAWWVERYRETQDRGALQMVAAIGRLV
jgi:hypothetical protein